MSLINRMLQDLESRRAAGTELGPLSGDVRSLPRHQAPSRPWALIAAGVAVAGLLAAAISYWQREQHIGGQDAAAPVPAPMARKAPAQTAPPPIVQPEATPPQAAALVPPAEAAAPPVASPALKSAPVERRDASGLRLETTLNLPREYLSRSTAEPPAAKRALPAPAPRSQGEGAPRIDKQMRTASPAERAESEYRKAAGLLNQGRLGESFESLRAALQADAGHAAARLLLTNMLMEQKRLDEAEAVLREGLALNSALPQLAMRLARIQVERGELGGAAETLQKAAAAATENAEYRGFHAAVLQRLGRHKEAAEEFRAALRLAPQAGIWWMGLGISLEEAARPAEALEAYQRARASGALTAELDKFVERKLRQLQ